MNHSPIPRYYRIANILRNRIINEIYQTEMLMPTEQQLSQEFNVSRVTIRQSLKLLEEQGLVVRKQGAGTYANKSAKLQPIIFTGQIEDIMFQQFSTKVSDIKIMKTDPNDEIRGKLRIPYQEKVLKVERIRQVNGDIISYVENYFPESVERFIKEEEIKDHSFVELLENYGFEQRNAVQSIHAISADSNCALKLHVPVGAPVLFSEIIIYDPEGMPINMARVFNHSDRYNYTVNLSPY